MTYLRSFLLPGAMTGLLLLGGLFSPSARAQVTTYIDDPAGFDAASSSVTQYNFAYTGGTDTDEGTSFALGPLNFSTPGEFDLYQDEDYGAGIAYLGADGEPGTLDVSLTGATALELTLGTFAGPDDVSVLVNGSPVTGFSTTGGDPESTFYGLTSTVPITSVVVTEATGGELDTVSFEVGGIVAVPEPPAWALLLLAGGAVLFGAQRLRRQTA